MTIKILSGNGKMDGQELRFLLAGPSGDIKPVPNPTTWLDDIEWTEVYRNLFKMSELDCLKGMDKYFIQNEGEFKKIFDSGTPETEPLPGDWDSKLNSFQRMIVLKAIRIDKIVLATQNYIVEHIGEQFITPPIFDLRKSYKESALTTPLVFILSKGADP